MERIKLGVSACMLGEPVRYDGGHALDRYLRDTLGQYVQFVPVCPEVELGLPTPRPTLRLVGDPERPRLVFSQGGEDITDKMTDWAEKRAMELEKEDLCGFVFKSRSPSSGMERVKLYDRNGVPQKGGVGIFARVFMEHFPLVPVEEDGRLHDPRLRENFIESLFTFKRWRDTLATDRSRGGLVAFHTRHKLLILAHSPELYREMGELVATAKELPLDELLGAYQEQLMNAMRQKATVSNHVNVLQHMLGYFKKELTADEKQEVLEIVARYQEGILPLIVPVTLLKHFVRKYDQPYLREQVYLDPHPVELQLRNHV
ncbi:MAG: DUF1722 domain-containing protein [Desulfuromonas sp.]|uniref:YbgA family protein n=1 Tax=Desulfuromonas sp. TaxID=892 RepID=UPI000CBD0FD0|nr:DUF523 and DUF1722 domain-containing protein [Desulfuromonas sp.]PLX82375.1 MAG: DUF1722 domain-containing protein [Desulfuromonas sp.]